MATSKLQKLTSKYLSENFGRYTIRENSRPEWLLDSTGRRLELDFYIGEIGVAIEVQGEQHYRYIKRFHGNADGFKDQLTRDRLKLDACTKSGITLIEISSEGDFEQLLTYQHSPEELIHRSETLNENQYNPYIGIDKDHAIKSIKMRLEEIERLKQLAPVPFQSIRNTMDMIREISYRYCLTSCDI